MYYQDEISKFIKLGMSDQQIIDYFNQPVINQAYINIVKKFNKCYSRRYPHTFKTFKAAHNKPAPNSPLRPAYDKIVKYGVDEYRAYLKKHTVQQTADMLGIEYLQLRHIMRRYFSKRRTRNKPKFFKNAKSFSDYLRKKPKMISNLDKLLQAF